jgi:hypothetical protein
MPALPAIPPPQTQEQLINYFLTNAHPTQEQFAELIATMFYYANEAAAIAAETVPAVNAGGCITAWLDAITTSGDGNVAIVGQQNIASIVKTATGIFTVTFATAMEDANYAIFKYQPTTMAFSNKTAAGFRCTPTPGVLSGPQWPPVNTAIRILILF